MIAFRWYGLDGVFRRSIGQPGAGEGELSAPGGVAVAANGDLYIADFYNQRVQQLRADGAFVRQWGYTGRVGVLDGRLNYPTDVAISPNGGLLRLREFSWAQAGTFSWRIFTTTESRNFPQKVYFSPHLASTAQGPHTPSSQLWKLMTVVYS